MPARRLDIPVKYHGTNLAFVACPSPRVFAVQRENFWVKHYAGKVKYTVEGWVERNMDRVPESFSGTLAASTHKVRIINC